MARKPTQSSAFMEVDLGMFADMRRSVGPYWAKVAAHGMQDIIRQARDAARQRTAEHYNLHSDYIPKSILSAPEKDGQLKAVEKSILTHFDCQASVFLRPGTGAKSVGFMVPHETGESKGSAKGGYIAVPAEGVENYSFRTSKGAVKKAYKPGNLLSEYGTHKIPPSMVAMLMDEAQSGKPSKKKGKKGEPFIMKSGGVSMIARRVGDARTPLEILYVLKKKVQSDGSWGFEPTVRSMVKAVYREELAKRINGYHRDMLKAQGGANGLK